MELRNKIAKRLVSLMGDYVAALAFGDEERINDSMKILSHNFDAYNEVGLISEEDKSMLCKMVVEIRGVKRTPEEAMEIYKKMAKEIA